MPARTLTLTPFLRLTLLGDAAASGATGLLLTTGAGPLAQLLGLPTPLLHGAGLVLLPYVAFIAWTGTCERLPRWAVRAAVIINLFWAVDSALLLAAGPVSPTALGVVFVLAQALVVLGFAAMQWSALRQAKAGATPVCVLT